MFGRRIRTDVIREHWDDVVRLVASLKAGTVLPSAMLKRLAGFQRQNQLDFALQELGRIERTLFTLVMWNMAGKRKRRVHLLRSPQSQRGPRGEVVWRDRTGTLTRYHGAQTGQRVGARHARTAREKRAGLRVAPLPPRKQARRL